MMLTMQEKRSSAALVHLRWEKDDTEGWLVLY